MAETFLQLWDRLTESVGRVLYHGSSSPEINGPLRMNERDSGWFGTGFYLTAYPDYAERWGQFIYQIEVPSIKFAEVQVIGNYSKINYISDSAKANEYAGGTEGWIENESLWSARFTEYLKRTGYSGVRVHFNDDKDVEVLVFNPAPLRVVARI